PGHVDFSYEVSRTLAACEGAVLLVDATQGIQAQTVAHFYEAKKQNLVMIPVLNKIDLPNAQTEAVKKELVTVFGFREEDILLISAKTGENVQTLLEKIITTIPAPQGGLDKPLRALIFDAVYDEYRGVIAYIKMIDGSLKKDDQIQMFQNNTKTTVTEVGFFDPFLQAADSLGAGEIGYVITGIKDIKQCRVGDTIISEKFKVKNEKLAEDEKGNIVEALAGYTTPKPMVFFGMFPKAAADFARLRESLGKLTLNDTALTYAEDYSAYLGSGFRVGFLGLLHAEIVKERLQQEFGLDLLLTMPQVLYEKEPDGQMREPYMLLTIYVPVEYVGNVMTVCQKRKGNMLDLAYHETYATLTYELPYTMFIRGLSAELKSVTAGYASIDYETAEYRIADLVSVDMKINDNVIDVLSELTYRDDAIAMGRQKA
ncbi:MAG: GTP-binding protein, partial [Rhabdochlamydiaceae bacterium]